MAEGGRGRGVPALPAGGRMGGGEEVGGEAGRAAARGPGAGSLLPLPGARRPPLPGRAEERAKREGREEGGEGRN